MTVSAGVCAHLPLPSCYYAGHSRTGGSSSKNSHRQQEASLCHSLGGSHGSTPCWSCRACRTVFWPQVQGPRKGGFSKGGFCRVQCHGQGSKEYPRILAPAVHLAPRAAQPREAYILQSPLLKTPFSWFLTSALFYSV